MFEHLVVNVREIGHGVGAIRLAWLLSKDGAGQSMSFTHEQIGAIETWLKQAKPPSTPLTPR